MKLDIDHAEKRKRFNERWPAILSGFDRSKFPNRRAYKAKVGWARRALWNKIIKELLSEKEVSGVSAN